MTIEVRIVDADDGAWAFAWHREFADADEHIFPRQWDAFRAMAEEGRLFAACEDGNILALAYFCLDDGRWEIGGLMVANEARGRGLGAIMARVALGHVLFEEDPLDRHEPVISHVHADNPDPRPIMEHVLKFRSDHQVCIPGDQLPGLKTDENGNVNGDEYVLAFPESLLALAAWCDAWNGKLKDGTRVQIVLREGITLSVWSDAFHDMVRRGRQ